MASETRPVDSEAPEPLLTEDDPPPVRIVNPTGRSSFLLIGDHAGNHIPSRLDALGLNAAERARHIAWDIGVAALGDLLAALIDAVFIKQTYSRLVVDCNRAPDAPDAIALISDGTPIPGNADLDDAARAARYGAVHEPYQARIAAELGRRDAAGLATVLVALHSFTPAMGGRERPWQVGILHDRGDPAFALACLRRLQSRRDLVVGDNEPYRMDLIDYTIPRHTYEASRPYVEIEVRQDLLEQPGGPANWARILAEMLSGASAEWGRRPLHTSARD